MDMTIKRKTATVVMAIDPTKNPTMNSKAHYGLYPFYLDMRKELFYANVLCKRRRKKELKVLYEEDLKREDEELRLIGRAYMISQR